MKTIRASLVIILFATLFSCEPPVTFKEPQPLDTDNLSSFPKRLRGTYFSLSDSTKLRIDANTICRLYDASVIAAADSNGINLKISGDTSISISTTQDINSVSVAFSDDANHTANEIADTIFAIDYDNVLRKFKGYYFINTRYDKDSWQVQRLSLSKGELRIGSISEENEIDDLKELSESSADTAAPYKFSMSKKQFKKFNKGQGFSDNEVFVKLKGN